MRGNIYLIGFMGSGKTTLGNSLAKKMFKKFIDADEFIENKLGMPITGVFEKHGESFFRDQETEFLKLDFDEEVLVSTGGGMPCFNNNIDLMKAKGVVVFIDLPPKVLLSRLQNEKSSRPLIKSIPSEELLSEIERKINQRLPYYLKADIYYNSLIETEVELMDKIKAYFNK